LNILNFSSLTSADAQSENRAGNRAQFLTLSLETRCLQNNRDLPKGTCVFVQCLVAEIKKSFPTGQQQLQNAAVFAGLMPLRSYLEKALATETGSAW
jgi:hypothetical protein